MSMVTRDSMGVCVWWSKKRIVGRPSPADGDALAILHGMQIAKEHSWKNVVLESDCLQFVNCLSLNHCRCAVHNLLGMQIKAAHLEAPHQRKACIFFSCSHMEMAALILNPLIFLLLRFSVKVMFEAFSSPNFYF